jgi:hypothetical protein
MINYTLAIICITAAVVYFAIPAGQLPIHMPGYEAGSEYIQIEHAIIAIIAAVIIAGAAWLERHRIY